MGGPRHPEAGSIGPTDAEEFWSRHDFVNARDAEPHLQAWERFYNCERFSLALGGKTPAEKLAGHLGSALPNLTADQRASTPPQWPIGGRAQ